ncbi:MAG: hypothetical protein CMQ75_03300 [Gammaproteobacteria bacterium]|mgnify:CR=1 FL=1|nr:hypothetical protein [Gammaproteobacteria bacterium]|tara:strand:+ start:7105 stop:7863 length:759 start_codon:yes stop_codon:yes gene_type:complete
MDQLKNMWLPHIPKNAGTSLCNGIVSYTIKNKDFDLQGGYDVQWFKCINKQTNKKIHFHHNNGLEKGMDNWLKILIIRDPIDRVVSMFNFVKWLSLKKHEIVDNRTFEEFLIDTKKKKAPKFLKYMSATNHIEYLNLKNKENTKNPLISKFTYKNLFDIFDHIIDISLIHKIYKLIEFNFSQQIIKWPIQNTSNSIFKRMNEQLNVKLNAFVKNDINKNDMDILLSMPEILTDIEFYETIKTKHGMHFYNNR